MPPRDLSDCRWACSPIATLLAGRTRAAVLAEVATLQLTGGQGSVLYFNLDATLLGWALARGRDAPYWPAHVSRRLLEPLGIQVTVFANAAEQIPPGSVPDDATAAMLQPTPPILYICRLDRARGPLPKT